MAPQNFTDWRTRQDVFTGLAAIGYASISVRPEPGREPETLETQAVTAEFFQVLGVAPLVGRAFSSANEVDGNARVAVISHGLWQRRFGGAADVVGRHLPGQRADFEILGVMPPSFAYPVGAIRPTEVWIPNVFLPEDRVRANEYSVPSAGRRPPARWCVDRAGAGANGSDHRRAEGRDTALVRGPHRQRGAASTTT